MQCIENDINCSWRQETWFDFLRFSWQLRHLNSPTHYATWFSSWSVRSLFCHLGICSLGSIVKEDALISRMALNSTLPSSHHRPCVMIMVTHGFMSPSVKILDLVSIPWFFIEKGCSIAWNKSKTDSVWTDILEYNDNDTACKVKHHKKQVIKKYLKILSNNN